MSKQHTPGPWRVHRESDKVGILTASNVEHLATTHGFRKEENARLMAAAPMLLAALKRLVTEHADLGEIDLTDDERAAIDCARAAIAQAEGTDPTAPVAATLPIVIGVDGTNDSVRVHVPRSLGRVEVEFLDCDDPDWPGYRARGLRHPQEESDELERNHRDYITHKETL